MDGRESIISKIYILFLIHIMAYLHLDREGVGIKDRRSSFKCEDLENMS
jgi:hypothetical protein